MKTRILKATELKRNDVIVTYMNPKEKTGRHMMRVDWVDWANLCGNPIVKIQANNFTSCKTFEASETVLIRSL